MDHPAHGHPASGSKLSRLRKGLLARDADSSTTSLASSTGDPEESIAHVTSIDSTSLTDHLTPISRASSEDRRTSSDTSRRLSKLVPSKLKRRKSAHDSSASPVNAALAGNISQELLPPSPADLARVDTSDSRRSSLTTDGSNIDSPQDRPESSTVNSNKGLSTRASPLIRIDTSNVDTDKADTNSSGHPRSVPPLSFDSPSEYHFCVTAPTPTDSANSTDWPRSGPISPVDGSPDKVDVTGKNGLNDVQVLDDKDAPTDWSTPKKGRGLSLLTTNKPPSTPPSPLYAPSTVVTPPTPTSSTSQDLLKGSPSAPAAPPRSRHRKSASVGSSKLASAVCTNDLTPPLEESRTASGSLTAPLPAGFFSGFITAAQSAATSIGSTINTSISQSPRLRQVSPLAKSSFSDPPSAASMQRSQRSVTESFGAADQNGTTAPSRPRSMTLPLDTAESGQDVEEPEGSAAARAVSTAYEKPAQQVTAQALGRPASLASQTSLPLEHSPTRASSTLTEPTEMKRSGSVRSKLSRRRHRGNSVGTTSTLAAALSTSASVLTTPVGALSIHNSHRHTGFAVASTKRNKEFHQLFRSVPEDDYLIEDYSAALQKDILVHGRFYVSEGHVCFMSNIFGWVTNLVIAFEEIVSIEKKNTAIVFPNALTIATHQARNTFASFVARDSTYELLIGIWKTSQPNLKSSLNGIRLGDDSTGDKTEKDETIPTAGDTASVDGSDDVYDEDEEDEDAGSFADPGANGSIAGSEIGDGSALSRKTSVAAPSINGPTVGVKADNETAASPMVPGPAEFAGPATHAPTDCTDQATHYDKQLVDTTIAAPLGKVYNLWFGPGAGAFMRKWLVEEQKSRELSYEDDKTGLDATHKTFTFSYIKPLNAPVGPRQTKCIVTNSVLSFDLEKSISIDASTQTPDVPSGGIFTTKTRYCLMWGPDNSTRVIASCAIEWTGKSWLRGPIEKGANDGQLQYVKDLMAAIKAAVTTSSTARTTRKGKVRRRKDTALTTTDNEAPSSERVKADDTDWGMLEPLHGIMRPILGIVSPFITSQVIIAVLFVLLAQSWFFGRQTTAVGQYRTNGPELDTLWRSEEGDLWDWLETRVGIDTDLHGAGVAVDNGRQAVLESKSALRRIVSERLNDRQVDDAIKITEKRLGVLKDALRRRQRHTADGELT